MNFHLFPSLTFQLKRSWFAYGSQPCISGPPRAIRPVVPVTPVAVVVPTVSRPRKPWGVHRPHHRPGLEDPWPRSGAWNPPRRSPGRCWQGQVSGTGVSSRLYDIEEPLCTWLQTEHCSSLHWLQCGLSPVHGSLQSRGVRGGHFFICRDKSGGTKGQGAPGQPPFSPLTGRSRLLTCDTLQLLSNQFSRN